MGVFTRKKDTIGKGIKAPAYDPYGRFKNAGNGVFGFRKDKHVILPGVTHYEEQRLTKVKDYVEKETGKPCTLSQDLINDVYSIYVNDDVKRRPHNEDNSIRHKVLDKVYDSLTKVVTVDSPLYTQILTRELALALQIVDDEIKEEQKDQQDGDGDGDGEAPQGLESKIGSGSGEGEGGESQGEDDSAGTGAGKDSGSSNRKSIEDIVDNALDKAEKSKK